MGFYSVVVSSVEIAETDGEWQGRDIAGRTDFSNHAAGQWIVAAVVPCVECVRNVYVAAAVHRHARRMME